MCVGRAVREAIAKLHTLGEIHAPPGSIPARADRGIEQWLKEVPPDVFWLFHARRLIVVTQKDPHTPEGIFERGWVLYDAEEVPIGGKREIPPPNALASYEIRY